MVVRLDRPAVAVPLIDEGDAAAGTFRFDRSQVARLGRAERALLRQTLRRVEALPSETAAAVRRLRLVAAARQLYRQNVFPEMKVFAPALRSAAVFKP